MIYEFEVYPMEADAHRFWVAKSKQLKGCVGQGDTPEAAIQELSQNETSWLAAAAECGIEMPDPDIKNANTFSGKVSLRFSPFAHEQAAELARQQGISLNQYLSDAVTYYNSMLMERSYPTPKRALPSTAGKAYPNAL